LRSEEGRLRSRRLAAYDDLSYQGRNSRISVPTDFDRRSKEARAKRLVSQFANLGFETKLMALALVV
jgi:hypothetical protein